MIRIEDGKLYGDVAVKCTTKQNAEMDKDSAITINMVLNYDGISLDEVIKGDAASAVIKFQGQLRKYGGPQMDEEDWRDYVLDQEGTTVYRKNVGKKIVDPAESIRSLLRTCGVPEERIPVTVKKALDEPEWWAEKVKALTVF